MSTPFTATAPRLASERSAAFLRSLMLNKAVANGYTVEDATAKIDRWLEGRTQREVSANIDRLKAEGYTGYREHPTTANGADDMPDAETVPAGRYAVDTEDGAINEVAFYKVDRPTEGRWAGYVFVRHIVGDYEERVSFANTKAILAKIAEVGAAEASARYGHEIGECGVCGRQLTNDESRERGIGPICADKMGW